MDSVVEVLDLPAKRDTDVAQRELRILCGAHAGARAPLRESDACLAIGRTTDNDIVLRDSPGSTTGATIARNADGWTWTAKSGAAPITLPLGAAVRFGSAVLTIDDARAPWPDVDRLVIEPEAPETTTEAMPPMLHDDPSEPEDATMPIIDPEAAPQLEDSAAALPAQLVATKKPRMRWRAPAGALLVAGAAVAVWISLGLVSAPATQVAAAAPIAPTASAESVRTLIGGLGLADSLKVLGAQADALKVVGVVDDDTQRDELRERLSALRPMPMANVLTRPEFKTEVDALAKTLEPGLKLAVNGRGGLLLSGVVNEAREADAVSLRIAAELPTAVRMDKAVRAASEVVAEFSQELARRGLAMQARLEGGQMIVDGTLAHDRVAQWESAILDFNKRYGERIPFVASLNDDPRAAAGSPAAASGRAWLPPIASVVGGDAPYLVMADGRKVMLGGTLNGYELVAIRNDALVLKAGHGALREVAR